MTDTKKSTSMQSSEQGTPSSSSEIEYWVERQSGKTYASKNDGGQQLFSPPLSESEKSISPQSFNYSPSAQISQNEGLYDRYSESEFQNKMSKQSVGAGSSKSSS